jgi:hypothetical protein
MYETQFWARIDLFSSACIMHTQSSLFDTPGLLRFIHDAPQLLSYADWLAVSDSFFRLPASVAEALWHTFFAFVDLRSAVAVTRQFAIFLFFQLYNTAVVVQPQPSVPEQWPSADNHSLHAQLSPTRTVALHTRAGTEHTALVFCQRHMRDFLMLLAQTDGSIRLVDIDMLGLLIQGGRDTRRPSKSLAELCIPLTKKAAAASSSQASLNISDVTAFISKRLVHSEYMYPSVFAALSHSSRIFIVDGQQQTNNAAASGVNPAVGHNGHSLEARPSFDDAHPLCIVMEHRKCIVRRASASPLNRPLILVCNSACELQILDTVPYVHIFGCTDCAIVIGACSGIVHMEHCERTTLCVAARCGVHFEHCADCTLQALTNTPVVVRGANANCLVAPLLTAYAALEEDLMEAHIQPARNMFGTLLPCVTPYTIDECGVGVMQPSQLSSMVDVAFDVQPRRASSPRTLGFVGSLPREWDAEMQDRAERVRRIHAQILDACAHNERLRADAQQAVQLAFREWLHQSGQMRHVHDVLHADVLLTM